jgi:hypothetical protein
LKPQSPRLGLREKGRKKGGEAIMEEKINTIIPTLMAEMASDGENESEELLRYYMECNTPEKAVINNIMIYLCGWSFETLLEKCGIKVDEKGEPILSSA